MFRARKKSRWRQKVVDGRVVDDRIYCTQKNSTKFSGMLGEDENMIPEKNCKQNLKSDRANWKKATPRISSVDAGETDCN